MLAYPVKLQDGLYSISLVQSKQSLAKQEKAKKPFTKIYESKSSTLKTSRFEKTLFSLKKQKPAKLALIATYRIPIG